MLSKLTGGKSVREKMWMRKKGHLEDVEGLVRNHLTAPVERIDNQSAKFLRDLHDLVPANPSLPIFDIDTCLTQ